MTEARSVGYWWLFPTEIQSFSQEKQRIFVEKRGNLIHKPNLTRINLVFTSKYLFNTPRAADIFFRSFQLCYKARLSRKKKKKNTLQNYFLRSLIFYDQPRSWNFIASCTLANINLLPTLTVFFFQRTFFEVELGSVSIRKLREMLLHRRFPARRKLTRSAGWSSVDSHFRHAGGFWPQETLRT